MAFTSKTILNKSLKKFMTRVIFLTKNFKDERAILENFAFMDQFKEEFDIEYKHIQTIVKEIAKKKSKSLEEFTYDIVDYGMTLYTEKHGNAWVIKSKLTEDEQIETSSEEI